MSPASPGLAGLQGFIEVSGCAPSSAAEAFSLQTCPWTSSLPGPTTICRKEFLRMQAVARHLQQTHSWFPSLLTAQVLRKLWSKKSALPCSRVICAAVLDQETETPHPLRLREDIIRYTCACHRAQSSSLDAAPFFETQRSRWRHSAETIVRTLFHLQCPQGVMSNQNWNSSKFQVVAAPFSWL